MKTLSRILFTFGLILVLAVANAQATTIALTEGDLYYVGLITPDHPASEAQETGYLATLITLAPGAPLITIGSESYSRVDSVILTSLLPAVTSDGDKFDFDGFEVAADGTFYILGKYDAANAGAWVWLVTANAGDIIDLPDKFVTASHPEGYGLSHVTLWSTTPVPEPGTLLLLGGGLLGLGILARRRMNK